MAPIHHFFDGHLVNRIISIPIPTFDTLNMSIWEIQLYFKNQDKDRYELYSGKPVHHIDGAWVWTLGLHLRVTILLEGGLEPAPNYRDLK